MVDEPSRVGGLDGLNHVEITTLCLFCFRTRAVQRLREDAGLQWRVDLATDRNVLPCLVFALILHVCHEVPVNIVKG